MERISAGLTYRFEEFEVDVLGYELRRSGQRIRLARQPMDLLLLLLERPQELVSREEITIRLWGTQTNVDPDAGIHTAILRIRQALCDSRESPRFIETSAGKGYRFIAPVETAREGVTSALLTAPANSIDRYPCNLSAELTSFVGRQQELKQLPVILASSRLLSLTGPGGVGKTRLAASLARELVRQFHNG